MDLRERAVGEPEKAVVLLHGRGATAGGILELGAAVADDALLLAPQAPGREWYPESFLAPREENQPHLDDALATVADAMDRARDRGFAPDRVALLGFSQGACLATEYAASNPRRYRAVVGLSGGLIGEEVDRDRYSGDLAGTEVFLGCSDEDPHIPAERVIATASVLDDLGGDVERRFYGGMGHTVNQDEKDAVRALLG